MAGCDLFFKVHPIFSMENGAGGYTFLVTLEPLKNSKQEN